MLRLRQFQICCQQHPPQPGQGITPGFRSFQQAVYVRRLPHRPVKPAVQSLTAAVVGKKVLLTHPPQPGENGPLTGSHIHRSPSCRQLPPQHRRRFLRQKGYGLLRLSRPQEPADVGGRGNALHHGTVVLPASARKRYRLHGKVRPAQGLQVFNGQDVVGLSQQRRILGPQQLFHRQLPAPGKGFAPLQPLPDGILICTPGQACFHPAQSLQIAALAAEGQVSHHPGFLQQLHAAPGKSLGSGHCPGGRQLQHQVRPVPDGHFRPGELVHGGKLPPLGEAAAHGAHHRPLLPQLLQHPPVPQMKGVVFADHTENRHAVHPLRKITNSYKPVTISQRFFRHFVQRAKR